jgi:hypothetical protein
MRCPLCATEVSEHQKFCHECGAVLSTPPPDGAGNPVEEDDTASTNPEAPTEPIDITGTVTEPVDITEPPDPGSGDAVTEPVRLTATTQMAEVAEVAEVPSPRSPSRRSLRRAHLPTRLPTRCLAPASPRRPTRRSRRR